MKVGFIGLGNVGGKLASNSLLRNKFDLTVIDLDFSSNKRFYLQKGPLPLILRKNWPKKLI